MLFGFVAVWNIAISVAVSVSPFWPVAVVTCRRFEHRPFVLRASKISNKSSPTHPGCSCSNYCPGSKNSNTSLLFWNIFTGLKFLNELNIKSSLSQNSQYHSAFVSVWPHIYSASSRSQQTLFTLCHSDQTIITHSHSSILPTCFTSSLEPAPYITQNSSSESVISLSATFIVIAECSKLSRHVQNLNMSV